MRDGRRVNCCSVSVTGCARDAPSRDNVVTSLKPIYRRWVQDATAENFLKPKIPEILGKSPSNNNVREN